jgi:hypothetical protein
MPGALKWTPDGGTTIYSLLQGPKGEPGQDGADGADGVDGQDGATGPQGPAGDGKTWDGTQAQYNALGSYEPDRTYYIVG